MHRVPPSPFVRPLLFALIAVLVPCVLPGTAAALKVKVNCNLPADAPPVFHTINGALAANTTTADLVLVVKGTCTENVVIERDDVTIKTNGIGTATIVPANNNDRAVFLDGARRIVIDGVIANGITVSGGTFGISTVRGGALEVKNCQVTGASRTGIIASYSSTVTVDACSVTGNVNGISATNTASVVVTNTTVNGNTGTGLTAARGSYLRAGQDASGTATAKPVTVSGSGGTGISINEDSSGNVVATTVANSGGTGILVGRGSSGQIGVGAGTLTGGTCPTCGISVTGSGGNGIAVEGANATIAFSTITGNGARGIVVNNGASARIGVTNTSNVPGPNTISHNGSDGIGIFHASSAYIGSNEIEGNTFGISIGQATASIVGGNNIINNDQTGVNVRAGQALIGDPGFLGVAGPPATVNTISGNGSVGPNTGGIMAFQGAEIQVADAVVSNNTGTAVQAFEAAVIELRGATAVTVPASGTTDGASIQFGSTFRLRDTASIVSATGHGISASNLSAINIRDNNTVQGNGPGKFGVNCFPTLPMTASATTFTGSPLANVTGAAGPSAGCNVFQ